MTWYNEFNPESAAMIRQFMEDGLIPKGIVDERSITDIDPDELKRYTQCHFFAGIAGWTFALQLAGWPPDRPVWTGSCPCQPFSSAGKQRGKEDDRHLWPVWERLIRECKPATVFGEQVASAITHGWLDDVYQGLEAAGYAVGSAVLPAVCVGAPHRRERLWFVAHNKSERQRETWRDSERYSERPSWSGEIRTIPNAESFGRRGRIEEIEREGSADQSELRSNIRSEPGRHSSIHNPFQSGLEGQPWNDSGTEGRQEPGRSVATPSHWHTGVWIDCLDGKKRLVEPGIQPLVNGFQHRRAILHAIGNAIVPQVAAQFIKAVM